MGNKLFYVREFLNREGEYGLGAILAELTKSETEGVDSVYATLTISGCSRSIEIDLHTYDPEYDANCKYFENSLEKLGLIERAVSGLRDAMIKDARDRGCDRVFY